MPAKPRPIPKNPLATARDGTRRGRKPKDPKTRKQRGPTTERGLAAPLTAAQEAFLAAYLARFNATQAYLDSHPGCTYRTAGAEGCKLLQDPRIAKEIEAYRERVRQQFAGEGQRVLGELMAVAYASLADVFDKDGLLAHPKNLERHVNVALKKIKRTEIMGPPDTEGKRQVIGHNVEIEMHDKLAALDKLGRHYGLFAESGANQGWEALLTALQNGRRRAIPEAIDGGE